ncbi:MAG: hypothetical protein II488_04245, partial [Firmicutes bacterium]|nr:hypothetical protein [Bacillota bacterium]
PVGCAAPLPVARCNALSRSLRLCCFMPPPVAPQLRPALMLSPADGYIRKVDAESYGLASLALGAGRNTKEEGIDYSAGLILNKKTGDPVKKGELLATLYTTEKPEAVERAKEIILGATEIGPEPPEDMPLIIEIIRGENG